MAEPMKKRIGTMRCEGVRCKSHAQSIPVVVFENAKGTLSYRCDYCDRAPYARAGTDQHADWMQDMKLFQASAPKAAPVAPAPAVKEAPAAPVAKEKATIFG